MRFFHYTSADVYDQILASDLSIGHLLTPYGLMREVVWLTTDPMAEGHGLYDGTQILSDKDIEQIEMVEGNRPRNRATPNKMKIRLTFDIPNEAMIQLLRFTEFCEKLPHGKQFSKRLGLSCYMDISLVDPPKLQELMETRPTKEGSWWISNRPISAQFITAVDVRDSTGKYVKYDFEKLVRPALEELGLFCPSQTALYELQRLITPYHCLGDIKAFVICKDKIAKPVVIISGGDFYLKYDIETGKKIEQIKFYSPDLSAWVIKHRTELLVAWAKAKECYFLYYPHER